jgi:GR25 family glycosyltransferase involved in LPS biosynthesis
LYVALEFSNPENSQEQLHKQNVTHFDKMRILHAVAVIVVFMSLAIIAIECTRYTVQPFDKAYVITIRDTRWKQFKTSWWYNVVKVDGTDGKNIDIGAWLDSRKALAGGTRTRTELRRGQLGCLDSHVQVWENIVANNVTRAIVFEDDAEITIGFQLKLHRVDGWLEHDGLTNSYDLLWLGHFLYRTDSKLEKTNYSYFDVPNFVRGAHSYIITLNGAKKLLQNVLPYRYEADSYMSDFNIVRQLCVKTSMIRQRSTAEHDTAFDWY